MRPSRIILSLVLGPFPAPLGAAPNIVLIMSDDKSYDWSIDANGTRNHTTVEEKLENTLSPIASNGRESRCIYYMLLHCEPNSIFITPTKIRSR